MQGNEFNPYRPGQPDGEQRPLSEQSDSARLPGDTPPLRGGETRQEAKDKAEQIAGQAQETVAQTVDTVRQQASSRARDQKFQAAERLDGVAQAIRQTGSHLRDQEADSLAQYADQAADQVGRLARYLQEADLDEIVSDVERLARRQPALFLAGALALGFAGARFLKSSSRRHSVAERQVVPYSQRPIYPTTNPYPGWQRPADPSNLGGWSTHHSGEETDATTSG